MLLVAFRMVSICGLTASQAFALYIFIKTVMLRHAPLAECWGSAWAQRRIGAVHRHWLPNYRSGMMLNGRKRKIVHLVVLDFSCCHKQKKMTEDKDQLLSTNKHSLAQLICVSPWDSLNPTPNSFTYFFLSSSETCILFATLPRAPLIFNLSLVQLTLGKHFILIVLHLPTFLTNVILVLCTLLIVDKYCSSKFNISW